MYLKREHHPNPNVTKTQMSPKQKCYQNSNVIKTQMSLKRKCHQNANVTKTQMSPNTIVTKRKMSVINIGNSYLLHAHTSTPT